MKKSNILLIVALSLAFCWSILIGWFAASAINNYIHGKDPVYALSHHQYLESHKSSFPTPVDSLFISGEGTMILILLQGKELEVLSDPRIWNCVYTDLKNGKSIIRFKKAKEYGYYEPVTIVLPEIPSVALDNFSGVTLKGLNRKGIHLQSNRVPSFSFDSCKIGILDLEFPGNKDYQDISIGKSNRIDTFIASVHGYGSIRLETAGQSKNQVSLSDSIKVEATSEIIRKIAVEQKSRIQNK